MYNFFVDLIIWTFFIYGFIKFLEEFSLDFVCYIIYILINTVTMFKKFIAKFAR